MVVLGCLPGCGLACLRTFAFKRPVVNNNYRAVSVWIRFAVLWLLLRFGFC